MSELIDIAADDAIPDGGAAEIVAAGRIFAVYRTGDTFHVLDGICPHAGGPLGKGSLNGNVVTCPWHGWQFDVTSGQHCLSAQICQKRYDVIVRDGRLWIDSAQLL